MSFRFDFPDHLSDLVILDVDEVLLSWAAGFRSYLLRTGHDVDPAGPFGFDMVGWIGVRSEDEVQSLIRTFNASPWFAELPPCAGAIDLVQDLVATGHRLHVVTSCSADPRVAGMRQENLQAVFGDVFEEVSCIPIHASKVPELRRRPPALWIDDRLSNVLDGISAGHHGMVVASPQNGEMKPAALSMGVSWLPDLEALRPGVARLPHVIRSEGGSPTP